jgi:hypothetical protein
MTNCVTVPRCAAAAVGFALAVGAVVIGGAVGGVLIDPFLVEGEAAPGSGADYEHFDRPNVSELDAIAFTGDTDGPETGDDVLYVDATLVAREGTPAPGTFGAYSAFEPFETTHQVNLAGEVAYVAQLRDLPATADRAVYLDHTLHAMEGGAAAGSPGRSFADFGFVGAIDDGRVGFLARLDGDTADDSVVYLGGLPILREGDAVPMLAGATWDGDFDEIQWNGRGDVLFEGDTSLDIAMDAIVVRRRVVGSVVQMSIVAQEGQLVHAEKGPDFLELVIQTALAESGTWALRGNLGKAPSDEDAIILSASGFSAQQGKSVAGLPGAKLGNFNGIDVNSLGDVLYLADLDGATPPGVDEGLFANNLLLITDGVQVPGLPPGTVFTDIGYEDIGINDAGVVVFQASYAGTVTGSGLFTLIVPVCLGDLDESGDVGFADLLVILQQWGMTGTCPPPLPEDLSGDCAVGFQDLIIVLSRWGPC